MKNILILSAGRRVELVQAFQAELKKISPNQKVLCADLKPHLSSACQISDGHFTLPRATDPTYVSAIIKVCIENNVGMVVPTIDTELLPLANGKSEFLKNNIHLIVSDLHLISQCRDKRQTSSLFERHGLPTPKLYSFNDLKFPVFIKPYDGSSSVGAMKALLESDIPANVKSDPKMMAMEYINPEDFSEYTIDLYYDKSHSLKAAIPRKRIEIRSGEVNKGVTRKNALYDILIKKLSSLEHAIGCITLQVFFNENTNQVYGIEINPRFGGGYPLTYAANGNFPAWLIKEYFLNEKVTFFDTWEDNLLMLRYDAKVLVHSYA